MWIKTNGNSMLPLLQNETLILIDLYQTIGLKCGDIIVFQESNGFIAHRLINKIINNNNCYLRTKGDISLRYDSLINQKYYIGKVIALKQWGITIPINNHIGRFVGLVFSYLSPLLYYLWNKKKRIPQQCRI